jgi:hypothetical protein
MSLFWHPRLLLYQSVLAGTTPLQDGRDVTPSFLA